MNSVDAVSQWASLGQFQNLNMKTSGILESKDTDGDNLLNVEELGVDEETFSVIDKNGDGQAGSAELNLAYNEKMANEMLTNIIDDKDTDGDDVLNAEELGVDEEIFDLIDKNGDGQAGSAELNLAYQEQLIASYQSQIVNETEANIDATA